MTEVAIIGTSRQSFTRVDAEPHLLQLRQLLRLRRQRVNAVGQLPREFHPLLGLFRELLTKALLLLTLLFKLLRFLQQSSTG